jgi:hypothetical protein
MLDILIFIAIMGALTFGIITVVKVLQFLVQAMSNWIKEKIKNRKLQVFAVKLSKAVETMRNSNSDIETVDLNKIGCDTVSVAVDENGKIQDPENDIIGYDVKDLDTSKDLRDKQIINKLDNDGIIRLTA